MKIQKYENWMREQVIALFQLEYGAEAGQFDTFFQQFYEHPFQANDGIRIAAVDGEKVVGFQSFFHWPVRMDGVLKRSYQSGNSLVHPDYRGQGLFGKMITYIHQEDAQMPHDLLIGFPVEMSYGAFIKKKWQNPFDLQWYIKWLDPVRAVLTNPEKSLSEHWPNRKATTLVLSPNLSGVAQTEAYDHYRFTYQQGHYYRYSYEGPQGQVMFELKAQRRKKILKELIIGKIVRSNNDPQLLNESLRALESAIRKAAHFSFLSIAVNPLMPDYQMLESELGFRKINKKIHFVTTGPAVASTQEWNKWDIFRADIDTW